MDIRNLQHEKALVAIIFDRDTMIEQLGVQATKLMEDNKELKDKNKALEIRVKNVEVKHGS